jgi:para-aminobenzoate synthetase/4-amino-4-deoxychorismate lyase
VVAPVEGPTAIALSSGDGQSFVRRPLAVGVTLTAAEVLRSLRGDRSPFALVGEWAGGGAVLGSEPTAWCRSVEQIGAVFGASDAEGAVEGSGDDGNRFGAAWVGWLGYGAAEAWHEAPPAPGEPRLLPVCSFAYYDHVIRTTPEGDWWFEALVTPEREAVIDERFEVLCRRLSDAVPGPSGPVGLGELRSLPAACAHEEAVGTCVELIARGDLSQANLCMRFEGELDGSPLDLFCEAIERLRPPYGAFVARPEGVVLSLSPELFLRRSGRQVTSRPIKGTARRPDDAARAGAERQTLERSAKDRAENVMIVDLVRNDLGRVCEPGSIDVPRLCVTEAHPGVWHLVSEVVGTLRPSVSDEELLRATFPPGSVTGAPKVRAMEVIHELEASPREVYTGAVGYRSPAAGLELNVAIRTFESARGRVWLGAGGGIVADSVPAAELAECIAKAGPLVTAIGGRLSAEPLPGYGALRPRPAVGVFTTVRVAGGVPWRLDDHLARLDRSCRQLYGKQLPTSACDVVMTVIGGGGAGGRLRVSVRPVGGPLRVTAELSPIGPAPVCLKLRAVTVPGGLGAHKWSDRRLLDHLQAQAGGDQLLVCDADGTVLESGVANFFAVVDGELRTPSADGRLLDGIVRRALVESGVAVEVPMRLADLDAMSEAFVTNSLRGVAPVAEIVSGSTATSLASGDRTAAATRVMASVGLPSLFG